MVFEAVVSSSESPSWADLAAWTEQWERALHLAGRSGRAKAATVTLESAEATDHDAAVVRVRVGLSLVPAQRDELGSTAETGSLIPRLSGALSVLGSGGARPVRAAGLAETVRMAYDPTVVGFITESRLGAGSRLTWRDATAAHVREAWDHVAHDGAVSVSWMLADRDGFDAPIVAADWLSPHSMTVRRRVGLLYRWDRSGGLERLGLVATATALGKSALQSADSTALAVSGAQRLSLRRAYGAQAPAFAAALPLGLEVPGDLRLPLPVRAWQQSRSAKARRGRTFARGARSAR
ncbi:hypothetical protein LO772_07870 [Yinghuangia sp. ASG 101]|uniref:SCO6880 family protein n=1 Tax=Yinghuangia sp. ASG 101 TaxID=2896848 RepID=UPI001E63DAF9|nr:SCO6880 family protein [Yinghuangia sp. ASG 101]UGQ13513.1 hypothetical protein LO772_07870 [Yinghuangia sp. ASG 101]